MSSSEESSAYASGQVNIWDAIQFKNEKPEVECLYIYRSLSSERNGEGRSMQSVEPKANQPWGMKSRCLCSLRHQGHHRHPGAAQGWQI